MKIRPLPAPQQGFTLLRRLQHLLPAAVLLASLWGTNTVAQTTPDGRQSETNKAQVGPSTALQNPASEPADASKASATKVNEAAHAKLLADIHLLSTLTHELKAETAKSTPNTLSLSMLKKTEEIQKLAAAVRVEMAKSQ